MKRVINTNEEPKYSSIDEMHSESDRRVGQVFRTMLIFTSFMVIAPISTYFGSKKYIFESNKIKKNLLLEKKKFNIYLL